MIAEKFAQKIYQSALHGNRFAVEIMKALARYQMTGLTMEIKIGENGYMPTRAHPTDAGMDFYSPIQIVIPPDGSVIIDTEVSMAIPDGFVGLITSKSGLMGKGITSRGTIDSSYRGSIKAVLFNHSDVPYCINKKDKITQIVLLPIITPEIHVVDSLDETDRGTGSFGSTGR